MKLLFKDGKAIAVATDDYVGDCESAAVPEDFDESKWESYVLVDGTPVLPKIIPQEVSIRQAVLALYNAGLLDDVEALVATLPRPYQLEWERASVVRRDNGLVEIVRQQQGMTNEEIDDLFIAASLLT